MKLVTIVKCRHQTAISSVDEPVHQLVTSKFDYELTFNIGISMWGSPANESTWQMLPVSLSGAIEFGCCSECVIVSVQPPTTPGSHPHWSDPATLPVTGWNQLWALGRPLFSQPTARTMCR